MDSDTNDPQALYVVNDDPAQAQSVANPVALVGHVAMPNRGPAGPNNIPEGDLVDTFRVSLKAGQTIELDFSTDPATFDIDLVALNADGTFAGQSTGINSYECLRVTRDGDYLVQALVFAPGSGSVAGPGNSIYQLRISAPNEGSANCVNVLGNAQSIVAGQVVAQAATPGTDASDKRVASASGMASASSAGMAAAVQTLGLRALSGQLQANRPALLGLPLTARAEQLGAFSASMNGAGAANIGSSVVAKAAAGYSSKLLAQLPATSRDVLETIAYAKAMKRSGQFAYAFPNFKVYAMQTSPLVGLLPPDDRDYSRQRWHYEQISLPLAMQTLVGRSVQPTQRPIVAVVDTGIVSDHPDLVVNTIAGYDFIFSPTSANDGNGIDPNPDDSAVNQPSFHGAHVAGTVAAQGFNGIGGLGVAPMAQIMPLRVLGEGGSGSFYDIIQAIRFAARLPNDSNTLPARRADVINLSLGGNAACPAELVQLFTEVRNQGTVVVAASGNESSAGALTPVGVPANCPGVIAVGATDAQRGRAPYSNGSAELDVVAPGGNIARSTTGNGEPDGVFSTVAEFLQNGQRAPTYTYLQGTSMASPHMAGVVALMRWVNPGITPAQIDTLIANGSITDDLGAAGRDNTFGFGLINAKRAVDAAINLAGGTPAPAGQLEASPGSIDFGAVRSTADLLVQRVGSTTETVASISVSTTVFSVTTVSVVNASVGTGTYRVSADRNALAVGQTGFGDLRVVTNTGRTLTVALSVERRATATSVGSFGPVYVLALNGDGVTPSLDPVGQGVVLTPTNGVYRFTLNVNSAISRAPDRVYIVAGNDLDNDGFICNRGEACGGYPLLSNRLQYIDVRQPTVSNIDFPIAPYGGVNPSFNAATSVGMPSVALGMRKRAPLQLGRRVQP